MLSVCVAIYRNHAATPEREWLFIDQENEASRAVRRLGPTSWHDNLRAVSITIPDDEGFARD